MKSVHVEVLLAVSVLALARPAIAASSASDDARARLRAATGGAVRFSDHKATGAARFVRVERGSRARLGKGAAPTAQAKAAASAAFFRDYGAAMGIDDPTALRLESTTTDRLGETHLTWKQFHGAVPVLGGVVKTHFDAAQTLKAVTGTVIPDVTVNEKPVWSEGDVAPIALADVVAARGAREGLGIGTTKLWVFREGLAMGVPGPNHLAWEVEVTDGAGVRDLVYVDAHSGKVIERIQGIQDDLYRRAYDGKNLPNVPVNYPEGAYWLEGQKFPTVSTEANNMIISSFETYGFFANAFGRDAFDGKGAKMDAIFDRGYDCPNASWNGTFISFCPGLTVDDVTAHEWGHAYTQYTHALVYQWQPGALNEAYSDIWGETVDRINGRGTDAPNPNRTAAACSTFSPPVGRLVVNSPDGIAGTYFAQSAIFGPKLTETGITGDVVAALDPADGAGASTLDACSPLTNASAVAGKIALVNRGSCNFTVKVYNAQVAGAVAVVVENNVPTGLPGMGGGDDRITIPSVGVQQATGEAIRTALGAGAVNATLRAVPGTDASVRWLLGEDSSASGLTGALRDMWNPTCYSNPGKVSDTAYYECSTNDAGGVHTNSGVVNHAYALAVDGGTYNGQTISGIGFTKAAHIWFRAQDFYQVFDTDFADHADALEASCADLVGAALPALTGGASGEAITAADCTELSKAIAAVELRRPPACTFPTLLNPGLPPLCSATTTTGGATTFAQFHFDSGTDGFVVDGVPAPSSGRAWTWMDGLPSGRAGHAFFAPDYDVENACVAGPDQTAVMTLTSPEIVFPPETKFARATFWQWVATEPRWDGGNLSVSVNGGAWQVVPPSAFTFNGYTANLFGAADGSTNPIGGQPAWTGNDQGTVNGGSWGRTHVNLAGFAKANDRVRLRWTFGSDYCAGRTGWFVDDVDVFSCTPKVPAISVADLNVVENTGGFFEQFFQVTTTGGPTLVPVSVSYAIRSGTAKAGEDFSKDGITGTFTMPAGAQSGQIRVLVKGDDVPEGTETFTIQLSNPVNATIADGQATATITDDDSATAGL